MRLTPEWSGRDRTGSEFPMLPVERPEQEIRLLNPL